MPALTRAKPLAGTSESRPRDWSYRIPGSRDYRIDLLRGFLVFAMVVDHIGGVSPLTMISGDNQFLVSAAEGFVFVSGLLMGVVYGGRVRRAGIAAGLKAVLRRAWVLYLTVVCLTLAFVGLYQFTSVPLWMDRASGLGVDGLSKALVGSLTLHYTYHGTDILLIYVLLVGAAPLVFYLLATGRTRYALAGSWLIWAVYQAFPAQIDIPWTIDNSVNFPFASWQALFYTGLVLGYHRARLAPLTRFLGRRPILPALLLATIGMIALSSANRAGQIASLGIPGLSQVSFDFLFSKTALGPGRMLAFFLLAALAQQLVTRFWVPIQAMTGWLLVPLGQKSLLSYGSHLFLIGPAYLVFGGGLFGAFGGAFVGVFDGAPSHFWLNAIPQAAVLLIVWAFVKTEPVLKSRISALGSALQESARWLAVAPPARQTLVMSPVATAAAAIRAVGSRANPRD